MQRSSRSPQRHHLVGGHRAGRPAPHRRPAPPPAGDRAAAPWPARRASPPAPAPRSWRWASPATRRPPCAPSQGATSTAHPSRLARSHDATWWARASTEASGSRTMRTSGICPGSSRHSRSVATSAASVSLSGRRAPSRVLAQPGHQRRAPHHHPAWGPPSSLLPRTAQGRPPRSAAPPPPGPAARGRATRTPRRTAPAHLCLPQRRQLGHRRLGREPHHGEGRRAAFRKKPRRLGRRRLVVAHPGLVGRPHLDQPRPPTASAHRGYETPRQSRPARPG